jgi:hypothetical protein
MADLGTRSATAAPAGEGAKLTRLGRIAAVGGERLGRRGVRVAKVLQVVRVRRSCDVAGYGGCTYRGDWQMERARDGRARRVRNCMAAEILVGRESRVLAAAIGR